MVYSYGSSRLIKFEIKSYLQHHRVVLMSVSLCRMLQLDRVFGSGGSYEALSTSCSSSSSIVMNVVTHVISNRDDCKASRPKLELPSAGSGSLAQCKELAEPGDSPDGKSPMTPTAPHSPAMDTA